MPRRFARTDSESVEPCRPKKAEQVNQSVSGASVWQHARPVRRIIWAIRTRDVFQSLRKTCRTSSPSISWVGSIQWGPYLALRGAPRPQFGNFDCVWYKPTCTHTSTSWVGCTKIRLVIRQQHAVEPVDAVRWHVRVACGSFDIRSRLPGDSLLTVLGTCTEDHSIIFSLCFSSLAISQGDAVSSNRSSAKRQ